MDINQETAEERALFQRLRESYIDSLPLKLAEVTNAWDLAQRENWQADQVVALQRLVHKLAGSGSGYGLPEISQAARKLEQSLGLYLQTANGGKQPRTMETADEYRALRAALQSESRSSR